MSRCCTQALTGAQLYQMQQSPMPEEGERFRPAKDILLELFLQRASRPQAAGSRAASPDGQGAWQKGLSDGRIFCRLAEVLAEYLPLCFFNRKSRQPASCINPYILPRLPRMEAMGRRS